MVIGESAGIQIVASLMCADLSALGSEVVALQRAGIDGFHFDIMDAAFVPNLALSPMILASLRHATILPFEAHLMVRSPQRLLEPLARAGCNVCIVHLESDVRFPQILDAIRATGMRPGIAISPGTPLAGVRRPLGAAERVLVMTVMPGFAGQPIISGAAERVAAVVDLVRETRSIATVGADGSVNPATADPLVRAGARILVGGSSGLFHRRRAYADVLADLRALAGAAMRAQA